MKRVAVLLFLCVLLLFSTGFTSHTPEKYSTVIFYSPHADDEVLSMGASILQAKKNDCQVIVVLLSRGLASSAFNKVNKKLAAQNLPPITLEEFGKARTAEFKQSAAFLGADQVLIYDLPDGNFTIDGVKQVMNNLAVKFPNAQHHAMTVHDPHKDHAATGQALRKLLDEGIISSGVYHIPIQEIENIPFKEKDSVPFFQRNKYKKALDSYGVWSPEKGFYSIGQISVTNYFSSAKTELSSRWHP